MNERWKWIAPTLARLAKGARTGTGRAQQLPDNISRAGFRHPEPGCLEISLHLVHDRVSWNHYSMNDYFLSIIRGRLWSTVSEHRDGGTHVALPSTSA